MAPATNKRLRSITKTERVEARLNPAQKRRIEHAASLNGTSISDFIVSSADAAAARTIEQHGVWVLTDRDREVFVKALMHPPSLSPRMKAALKRYRKQVRPW